MTTSSTSASTSTITLPLPIMSSSPIFFQPTTTDTCTYGNYSIDADQNTQNGDLCATIPSISQALWACPAPNNVCWTWNHPCTGASPNGTDTTPGEGQYLYSKDGVSWCCLEGLEDCTRTGGQQNVCWANTFANPLASVQQAVASASASAIVVKAGEVFTTVGSSPAVPTQSPTSSTSSTGGPTAAGNATSLGHSSSNGLSGGAIAGVVIGVIAVLAVIANAVMFFLWYQRKRKTPGANPGVSEFGYASQQRVELPLNNEVYQLPADRPAELQDQTKWLRPELESPASDRR